MFPAVKSTSSGMADYMQTAIPVQATGEAEADNKELFGENKLTRTGNPSDLNVDMREVSVWNLCLSEYKSFFSVFLNSFNRRRSDLVQCKDTPRLSQCISAESLCKQSPETVNYSSVSKMCFQTRWFSVFSGKVKILDTTMVMKMNYDLYVIWTSCFSLGQVKYWIARSDRQVEVTPPPPHVQTHACKNITFPQLPLWW